MNTTRNCPSCKELITYKSEGYKNNAETNNRECRRCQLKHQAHIPNTECYMCHTSIYRIPSRLKSGSPLFCSYGCRNKYYSKENSFAWKGGKRQAQKRGRVRDKNRKLEKKIKAVAIMGGKCEICGYNKCIAALDFHHLNPMEKDATLKELWVKKWSYIEKEMKKCQLVCSNCHREIHWKETHGNIT